MPNLNFDRHKFAADLNARKTKKNVTLADIARESGVSKSTAGNVLRGYVTDINTVLSLCGWLRKDVNDYVVEGLPTGVKERWKAAHPDGRTVLVEHTDLSATATERKENGNIKNRRNRRYGSGFHGYEEFVAEFKDKGFIETEHITS